LTHMRSGSFLRRWASVACVIMMIALAFNVMESNSQAGSSISLETEQPDDLTDLIGLSPDDYIRRLTLAEGDSHEPRACLGGSGILYVAWIDDRGGTDSLFFKRSRDNGATFSADTEIPLPAGDPVDFSLSACDHSSEVGIAVEIVDEYNNPLISYLHSRDGGANWEPALIIGEGYQPQLSIAHGKVVITFLRIENGEQFLSAVVLEYDGSNLKDSYGLVSFPSDTSRHVSMMVGDSLNIAWFEKIGKGYYVLHLTRDLLAPDNDEIAPTALTLISEKAPA